MTDYCVVQQDDLVPGQAMRHTFDVVELVVGEHVGGPGTTFPGRVLGGGHHVLILGYREPVKEPARLSLDQLVVSHPAHSGSVSVSVCVYARARARVCVCFLDPRAKRKENQRKKEARKNR